MLAAALVLPGTYTVSAATVNMTVVSDTSAIVTATTGGGANGQNAVLAWKPLWGSESPWDLYLSRPFAAGAEWIWDTYRTEYFIRGDIVTFEKTFNVPGVPNGGTLYITADNGYVVWLNGNLVGNSMLQPWDINHLTEPYVGTNDWMTVENYTIPSSKLVQGNNVLQITAINEYMQTDDGHPGPGTEDANPAGLIFQLDISYEQADDGFTHTWGYWKTHSTCGSAPRDDTWDQIGENSLFFISQETYCAILGTRVAGGNAYYQLAHQYIAAQLNSLDGAAMRADVQAAYGEATGLLGAYTPAQVAGFKKGTPGQKLIFARFNELAGILDRYNSGLMGTPHAD